MPVLGIGGEHSLKEQVADTMKLAPTTCRRWSSPAAVTILERRLPRRR